LKLIILAINFLGSWPEFAISRFLFIWCSFSFFLELILQYDVDEFPLSFTVFEINSDERGKKSDKLQNLKFLCFHSILMHFLAKYSSLYVYIYRITSAVFQLYRDMNKLYKLISSTTRTLEIRHICV
jgi:hypothetical protein